MNSDIATVVYSYFFVLAAIGAGIGHHVYANAQEAFAQVKPIKTVTPTKEKMYNELYSNWLITLNKNL